MLRALLGALKTAFLAILHFTWVVITLPLRAVSPCPAASALDEPPDVAAQFEEALAADAARAPCTPDMRMPTGDNAMKVMKWAAETVHSRTGNAERVAAALPTSLRTWTKGLTADHARALLKAGLPGISAHIESGEAIEAVPTVQSRGAPQVPPPTEDRAASVAPVPVSAPAP